MSSGNDKISFVGNSGITDKGLPLRGKRVSTMPINQYSPQFNYSSNGKHPFESQPNPIKAQSNIKNQRARKSTAPVVRLSGYKRVSRIYNKFFNGILKRYITRRR